MYPFNPLSEQEQISCVEAVTPFIPGGFDEEFDEWDRISLKDPPKAEMLKFMAGEGPEPQRKANITFFKG